MSNIKFLKGNIEEKRITLVIVFLISIIIFAVYLVRLNSLIIYDSNFKLDSSNFIRLFNFILAILAVLSCLLSYSSNKNEDLFLISLMYIVFVFDILISNIMNSHNNNVVSYIAMGTSSIRIVIASMAISSNNFFKKLIINNKVNSLLFIILTTLVFTYLEYNFTITGFKISSNFFKIYHILLFTIYLIIAILFFIKSIVKKEYIYGVIGFSILIFSAKAIYSIASVIYKNPEIGLTSVSMTYIGFIIFILGLFIEVIKNIEKNKYLDKERSLFFNIIEENPHSNIIICDDKYKILYSNKKSIEMENEFEFLYKFKNNIKYKFNIKNLYSDKSEYDKLEKLINDGENFNESILIDKFNKRIDFSIHTFVKYNEKYKVIRFKDISRIYEMEKTLLEYESIKKEENMKNEFFANISHELKTPLNIIYSTMQLLTFSIEKENFKDIYFKYKDSLNINCKRMLRLIDNIVDITKLEIGFKVPEFNNYNIVILTENLTTSIVNYAKIKNIDIIFDTDIEDLIIKCDADMIERIILNLLSNSIKFTKNGGNILVNITSNDELVYISIKDNGIGIPIDIQPKIFNRFVQSDKSLIRENEGSGIGLSIVKSLVELMDGEIHLKSDGKNGTEFIISLPNKKLNESTNKLIFKKYDIDIQKIQLELSDIYELYNS